MIHHFDSEVAENLGVNAAIIVANLAYLQANREAQGGDKYRIDGRWWVHHTYESLAKIHPYFSIQQIRRIMRGLIESGAIHQRNPDRWKRDSYWSVALEFTHVSKSTDGSVEIDSSQVSESTVVLHDNKHRTTKEHCASLFAIFWDNYPRKTNKKLAQSAFKSAVKNEDTLNAIITNIQDRIEGGDWELTNKGFIPHPSTYLNGRRWEDEVVPRTTQKPNSTELPRLNSQAESEDFTKVSEDFAWIGKN